MSVPSAWRQTPAATSAAEPLLDPPDVRSRSCGLKVMPNAGLTLPAAYSSRLVLQNRSAPAARRAATTAASCSAGGGTATVDALVVTSPAMSMLSLTATGMPCNGPDAARSGAPTTWMTAFSRSQLPSRS